MEQGKGAVFRAAGIPREGRGVKAHCKMAGGLALGSAISIFVLWIMRLIFQLTKKAFVWL